VLRVGFAISLLVVSLAACRTDDDPSVVVPMYRGEPNGDDAALIGTLVVDEPCLLVELDAGERLLIAFPAVAAEWDDGDRQLTLGGHTFKPGDRVFFGGSGAVGDVEERFDWSVRPSPECEAPLMWISQATARLASEVP